MVDEHGRAIHPSEKMTPAGEFLTVYGADS
jgi:hypothetical protein